MEENYLLLRANQMAWYKQVKEEVFANDDHLTVRKIGDNLILKDHGKRLRLCKSSLGGEQYHKKMKLLLMISCSVNVHFFDS